MKYSKLLKNWNLIKFWLRTLPTRLLYFVFHFDKWHIYGSTKPEYVKQISNFINSQKYIEIYTLVEIGCGLGNILKSVHCANRIGFDNDLAVIKAARFIHARKKIVFKFGSFSEAKKIDDIDMMVAINWVHNLESEQLLSSLLEFTEAGILVLTEGVENYSHYHDRAFFSRNFKILEEIYNAESKRHFFLLKSIN